jgi:hypothetical protein
VRVRVKRESEERERVQRERVCERERVAVSPHAGQTTAYGLALALDYAWMGREVCDTAATAAALVYNRLIPHTAGSTTVEDKGGGVEQLTCDGPVPLRCDKLV